MAQKIWGRMLTALVLGTGGAVANAQSWQGTGEMPLDYRAYVRDFNSGDDRGLVEKYFTTDTQMISGSGVRNRPQGHERVPGLGARWRARDHPPAGGDVGQGPHLR